MAFKSTTSVRMRTNAVLSVLNKKTKAQKRKINHCLLLQDVCTHNILHMDGRTAGQTQMDGRRMEDGQIWMYVRYVRYVSRRGTYDGPISECAHAHIALIYIHNSLTLYCCFLFFSCSRNCGCVGDYWRSETDRGSSM